jgi:primosomal protein N' (replication factor Y) (superfamily II helicase)
MASCPFRPPTPRRRPGVAPDTFPVADTGPCVLVAVGRPVTGPFTYALPAGLEAPRFLGQRLLVPFGRGRALGFYLGPAEPPAGTVLKPITQVLEAEPALSGDVFRLLAFAAAHYRYPLGEALRAALPPGLSRAVEDSPVGPEVVQTALATEAAASASLARAPSQAATLAYLLAVGGRAELGELSHAVPKAREAIRRLVARGLVRLETHAVQPLVRAGFAQGRPEHLTPGQEVAVEALVRALDAGQFRPFLLQGVTGSGKTEVYLRAAEHTLSKGKGALVLVPEIALTPQLVGRFRSRFGTQVAVLHSGLQERERRRAWQALRAGRVRLAVGVRSAVFAPVADLGLLVVDEEHDPSFKQDEKLRYQARDLAVVRARDVGAVVVLGSATPSLESFENARRGKYEVLELPSRVDDRPLPKVELVDLRRRPRTALGLPAALAERSALALTETLAKGQQAILFLNRRGHSTTLLCEACGQAVSCTQCDVALTLHLEPPSLQCHYCGASRGVPAACPVCQGALVRLGTGTERVEAEVAAQCPTARVARLDRDSVGTGERLTERLSSFARGELDVLVGTQMVAKGHDFPGVTLVCVVSADTGLLLPDFRAAERTFQLLTQVAGRAGRGQEPGLVLVQTYNPEAEPVARAAAHDFVGFAQTELLWRRALDYPPYSRLAAIHLEGRDAGQTAASARALARAVERSLPPAASGVRLLGPAPAPLSRLRGHCRWQLLLKAPQHRVLRPVLDAVERALVALPRGVRGVLDVDPGAML